MHDNLKCPPKFGKLEKRFNTNINKKHVLNFKQIHPLFHFYSLKINRLIFETEKTT